MLRHLREAAHPVALDEHGRELTSDGLAEWLQKCLDTGISELTLVVGGPFGLAQPMLERCRDRFRLSALTLPHELARVVLLEQVYRGFTILRGSPYHHD